MNNRSIKKIVIVGGGSAGWLTAGIIAAEHQCGSSDSQLQVTLIESPDVNIVGVGEGTWPSMRNSLQRIGISETEFIRHCGAAFKQGSKFVGWKDGAEKDFYYHPFVVPNGYGHANQYSTWKTYGAEHSFADVVSAQSQVCQAGLAPKQNATPEYAGVLNYGYHLDASKFGQLLQQHCTAKLGITHIQDHVEGVLSHDNGDIKSLMIRDYGELKGDLFIDCTGARSLLLGQHFNVPFIDKKSVLFNDSAMALHVPYIKSDAPIESATVSTAQEAGWVWDIGLQDRRGVGYTYSSAHIDDEQAERTLKSYVAQTIGDEQAAKLQARKISFEPGHRAYFWHKNCVAVGLSAGFLEPLEASALALVELSATAIAENMPVTRDHMQVTSDNFNRRFLLHWENIVEFLKLHYVLSERSEPYWQQMRAPESISSRLRALLIQWRFQPPSRSDFVQNEIMFPSASYQYVLYGMGFDTVNDVSSRVFDQPQSAMKDLQENQQQLRKLMSGLKSNRDLLSHVQRYGFQKI